MPNLSKALRCWQESSQSGRKMIASHALLRNTFRAVSTTLKGTE
jgi:hypothetical protein